MSSQVRDDLRPATAMASPSAGALTAYLPLVARVMLGILFLWSGLGKFADLPGTTAAITGQNMPLPSLMALAAAVLEVFGALFLFAGFATRITGLALALFTVATMLIFHDYWTYPAEQMLAQQTNFLKNLSITGGMLMLAAFGAGPLSADSLLAARSRRITP